MVFLSAVFVDACASWRTAKEKQDRELQLPGSDGLASGLSPVAPRKKHPTITTIKMKLLTANMILMMWLLV